MALEAQAGSFDSPTSTGSVSVTGLAFQPAAILLWTGLHDEFAADESTIYACVGAYDGTDQWRASATLTAGGSSVSALWSSTTGSILRLMQAGGVVHLVAAATSLNADGFTVNFTTVRAGTPATKVGYLALGGSSLTGVKAGTATVAASSGNQSVTGVGFQPSALICGGALGQNSGSVLDAHLRLGVATDAGQACLALYAASGTSSASRGFHCLLSDCYQAMVNSTSVLGKISHVSFDSDGFTYNRADATTAYTLCYLALGGTFAAAAGVASQPASDGTQAVETDGVAPTAVLLASGGTATNAGSQAEWRYSVGLASGTAARFCASGHQPNETGTVFNSRRADEAALKFLTNVTGSVSYQGEADVAALSNGEFSLDWSGVDGTQREFLYLALGDAESGFDHEASMSGGAALGGEAAPQTDFTAAMSGGVTLGGTAREPMDFSDTMGGGLSLDATVEGLRTTAAAMSGGVTLGGAGVPGRAATITTTVGASSRERPADVPLAGGRFREVAGRPAR